MTPSNISDSYASPSAAPGDQVRQERRDKSIIFSAPMVRAMLDGRKTMTRRIIKPPKPFDVGDDIEIEIATGMIKLPYAAGDRLWVREACFAEELSRPQTTRPATRKEREYLKHTEIVVHDENDGADGVRYLADRAWIRIANSQEAGDRWVELFHYRGRGENGVGHTVPPIHMPRWASRLTLTVTAVKVERLQDITSADAIAEGFAPYANSQTIDCETPDPRDDFRSLWGKLHGPSAWEANPWVAAISFTVENRTPSGA